MSKKRRRDPGTIDTHLVEIYEDLSNESEQVRLKAAHSLLQRLAPATAPSKEKLLEVLVRLVRGLCSGRKAARLGFSVAFTEFLVQHLRTAKEDGSEQLIFSEVLGILAKHTEVGGNVSGQEERDHQMGRIFGAEAVITSGKIFDTDVTNDSWLQVLNFIFELALKKAWVREECGWVLYKSIKTLKTQVHGSVHAQVLIEKLVANGLAKTPEGVAIWLGVQSTFESIRLPPSVWPHESPLNRKEKGTIAKILKDASDVESSQAKTNGKIAQNSTWSPNVHFAWEVVLNAILRPGAVNLKKPLQYFTFADFWIEAVDNSLFSASASDQRKYWGFELFQRAIRETPADLIPVIFSKNFLRCFMNQLSSSDRYLHRNAEKTVKSIYARVENECSIAVTVLASLLKPPHGRVNFDQITKTKTVEKLLVLVKDDDLANLVQSYSTIISNPSVEDSKAASVERQIAADHLLTVIRSRQTPAGVGLFAQATLASSIKAALALFAEYAYFEHEETPSIVTPIADSTRSMFQSRISSCLNHIVAKSAQPAVFVYELVSFIRLQDQSNDKLRLIHEADDTVRKSVDKAWTTLQKVHSKATSTQGSKKIFVSAFELLYAMVLLQVYSGDADAVSMLDDLKSCYDNLIKHKSKSEEAGSDGLVEILLGFVAKPSSLFRRLASQVFGTCTSDISESGLQSMIKVLETKESVAGQDQLFDQADIADGEDEEASDVEVTSASPANGAEPSDSQSTEDTETELSDDNSTAAAEELAEFDAKLAAALGTRPGADDLIADDADASSDEDMNDEQMEALDKQLEKVFQERENATTQKSQKKDAREAIVSFKCRVLELLDIYVKQEHRNPLALELLLPLLHLIRTTKNTLVSSKACELMGSYSKLCKPNSLPELRDTGTASTLLHQVHLLATIDGSNAYTNACSRASLLLVKIFFDESPENLEFIDTLYSETLRGFRTNKNSKVRPSFFSDWINWNVNARNVLAKDD